MTVNIREFSPADTDGVVQVHLAAFDGFFLSRLGPGLLGQMYTSFAKSGMAFLVAQADTSGPLLGFAVGTARGSTFLRQTLMADPRGWALTTFKLLATRPRLILRLFPRVFLKIWNKRDAAVDDNTQTAYLLSIGVSPTAAGHGLGGRLLSAWEDLVAANGALGVKLETDTLNNDLTLRFYAAQGYERSSVLQQGPREMAEFRKAFE